MITATVIRKEKQRTSKWSGGVTTELAIWPQGADYAARSFGWRISTAKVELAESDFTALPGVSRWLMMLEGEIHLSHEGIRELDMKPFEPVARFDGGWKTKSAGRCVDFNLMAKDGYTGDMGYIPAGVDAVSVFESCGEKTWEAFYCLVPKLEISLQSESWSLDRGDFMLLYAEGRQKPALVSLSCACDVVPAARATVKSIS